MLADGEEERADEGLPDGDHDLFEDEE